MISTEKLVYRTYLILAPILLAIIILFETLFKNFTYVYSSAYILGALTSALCFFISIKAVDNIDPYNKRKTKIAIVGAYFTKLLIYTLIALFTYLYIYKYTIFTCFLGFFTIKLSIFVRYIIIQPRLEKYKSVDLLRVSDEIKEKLKQHDIKKFKDLSNSHKKFLLSFLSAVEYKKLHKALKEHELFVRGELEVIIDNENSDDDTKL